MFDPNIRSHARHRPQAIAISSLEGDVTYANFDADIVRVAAALIDAGHAQVRLAAVTVANSYVHWLILLAMGRLGIASCSIGKAGFAAKAQSLAPDLIITDDDEAVAGVKVLRATPEWARETLRRDPGALPTASADLEALGRVTLSSGTTGIPKKIGRSWAQMARIVASRVVADQCVLADSASPRRCMYLFGLDTSNFYVVATTWIRGEAVLLPPPAMFTDLNALRRLNPTLLMGSPLQLRTLVDGLKDDTAPMPNLTIISAGSHLPALVGQTLRLRITTNVWNFYGSTEASTIARGRISQLNQGDGVVGWVEPGAQAQAVDDSDAPVPPGVHGRIRVRTANMASSYMDDEDASAQAFKDGWFYPGDFGSISEHGLLRLVGRSSEVVNIGGVKFLPRVVEDAALTCKGVRDAAAFAVLDELGAPTPWLAVVRDPQLDEAELSQALGDLALPPIHLGWVSAIPRNDRGKVQRDRLIAAVESRK